MLCDEVLERACKAVDEAVRAGAQGRGGPRRANVLLYILLGANAWLNVANETLEMGIGKTAARPRLQIGNSASRGV